MHSFMAVIMLHTTEQTKCERQSQNKVAPGFLSAYNRVISGFHIFTRTQRTSSELLVQAPATSVSLRPSDIYTHC